MLNVYVDFYSHWEEKRNFFNKLFNSPIVSGSNKGGDKVFTVDNRAEMLQILDSYAASLKNLEPNKRYKQEQRLTVSITGDLDGQRFNIQQIFHTPQEYRQFRETNLAAPQNHAATPR